MDEIKAPNLQIIDVVVRIQSIFRGYSYRKHLSMLDLENRNALKIQNAWKFHLMRQKIQKVKEICALKLIGRVVHRYKQRKNTRKELNYLSKFDDLLTYYPSISRDICTTEYTTKTLTGSISDLPNPSPTKASNLREALSRARSEAPIPEPQVPDEEASPKKQKSMKRKTFIDLPPPWHDKDPRRLAQNTRDDLMYEQKANVQWAKSELLPQFISTFNKYLDQCDDLQARNERYSKRLVQCPFVFLLQRCTKPVQVKKAKEILCFNDRGLYVVASCSSWAMLTFENFTSDRVLRASKYQTNSPLLDVAIQPFSGQVVGFDSRWNLHIFGQGVSIISRKFNVPNKIPKSQNYLTFDAFGMLWVNLLYQGGHIYCVDPLTLQPALMISRETLFNINYQFTKLSEMTPVSFNNAPYGYICKFTDTNDIYIYSNEFNHKFIIRNKDMKSIPHAKQCGKYIVVWSLDGNIIIYELHQRIELIKNLGQFSVPSPPIDICYTEQPPCFYVSCEDATLRCYLSQDIQIPLRIPENKLLNNYEKKIADTILGPMKYTESRKMFTEFRSQRYTSAPEKIYVLTLTDKVSFIVGSLSNGSVSTISVVNDSQSVPAIEFDKFTYYEPLQAQKTGIKECNQTLHLRDNKRNVFLNKMSVLDHFDSLAISGQMRNLFYPGAQKQFSLTDHISKAIYRQIYPFLPQIEEKRISAYEAFHYMKRSGILTENLSDFCQFLMRFAPEDKKLSSDGDKQDQEPNLSVYNNLLPVFTQGIHNCITDVTFSQEDIENIIKQINPLRCLNYSLSSFTVSKAMEGKDAESTSRRWLSKFQIDTLSKKVTKLEILGDLVKHELMKRVQESINKSFEKNLLDKMLPVQPIDLKLTQKEPDPNIKFCQMPFRNPELTEIFHRTSFELFPTHVQYGRDMDQKQFLRMFVLTPEIYKKLSVQIDNVSKYSFVSRKVSICIPQVMTSSTEGFTKIVMTEDMKSLPLSYFLKVHSFLGADPRLLSVAKSICSRCLSMLYNLHSKNIILRTLYPDNIYLNGFQNQVMIGSLLDSQFLESQLAIPLPPKFTDYRNPFLPPEFFHKKASEWTTAFDVWQFGMLLLYILTGNLPKSYGEVLMSSLSQETIKKCQSEKQSFEGVLDENVIYPKPNFFYDWLEDFKVVSSLEKCTGECGEVFIQTDECNIKYSSILQLEHYSLLPYKNTKLNYDESKLFIEIIATCLQIDPAKRPPIEQLLRTYPFNQPSTFTETVDLYLKVHNPDIFVSQFISPVFKSINCDTFSFVLGVVESLMFHDEHDESDSQFAYPLDMQSNWRVVNTMYQLRFVDQFVIFVIKRMSEEITLSDVVPTISYNNKHFSKLLHFFMRFVSSVEPGQGPLTPYTNETVMALFGLYAANPYLPFSSAQILNNFESLSFLTVEDQSTLFVFTHTKVHGLIRYILSTSSFIVNALKRNEEKSDWYFNQFLSFGEAASNLAHSLCYGIEKQKGNAIKTLNSMFSGGMSTSSARIFVDFKIIHKVLHCLHLQSARIEAVSFLLSVLKATTLKAYDPTYQILYKTVVSPITLLHCCNMMKIVAGNDSIRNQTLQVVREIVLFNSFNATIDVTMCGIMWDLFETLREQQIFNLVTDILRTSCIHTQKLILESSHLQKYLIQGDIPITPVLDYNQLNMTLDISEIRLLGKQLTQTMFLYQYSSFRDKLPNVPPIQESIQYFSKAMAVILRESESVTKFFDTQVLRAARFDLKETTFLKAKNKAKELNVATTQSIIVELCDIMLSLFKNICYFWRSSRASWSEMFMNQIFEWCTMQIPQSRSKCHPATRVIVCFSQCILFILEEMPRNSPLFVYVVNNIEKVTLIFHRDYNFCKTCAQKNSVEQQVLELYEIQKQVRFNLFIACLKTKIVECVETMFRFFIDEMITNPLCLKCDAMPSLSRKIKFTVQYESIEILKYLTANFQRFDKCIKVLYELISNDKFIENQRKLINLDDNVLLMKQSLKLLNLMLSSGYITDKTFLANVKLTINSINAKYYREIKERKAVENEGNDNSIFSAKSDIKDKEKESISRRSLVQTAKRAAIVAPNLQSRIRSATSVARRSYTGSH
ncbi:IQ calmodulin-binding motif family protein [Trichomonas vaginalis G3]|uniref:non-specific serine/threonine protein kinase n=1 Tax=Trichomonas vaginalis (strain ATCC PRA-98 / G3) TaxID=412133 RepID=A2F375_TRIV3|nr:serine/threonine-protein kinase PIM family [Trichomonas vaginalis G3]EAY00634.1 IQ calmodulin-binding motif family protein [Trichomonas vaginalis G3]KAI5499998.1 serine/threonine-protein kinase PIM family [Trichomonas vaginalis G3]|eukprot:XP_001313563.1 IQ calmodulin-binding motif family protein [Trichomonas vaginalis G3]